MFDISIRIIIDFHISIGSFYTWDPSVTMSPWLKSDFRPRHIITLAVDQEGSSLKHFPQHERFMKSMNILAITRTEAHIASDANMFDLLRALSCGGLRIADRCPRFACTRQ
jgi:hypothetical protein